MNTYKIELLNGDIRYFQSKESYESIQIVLKTEDILNTFTANGNPLAYRINNIIGVEWLKYDDERAQVLPDNKFNVSVMGSLVRIDYDKQLKHLNIDEIITSITLRQREWLSHHLKCDFCDVKEKLELLNINEIKAIKKWINGGTIQHGYV